ncbi:hypothetical protein ONS95_003418 [Cadophora gregata]|uniref:uncharacterized protein n=1 Tax=Cadophora gregata TaxID=51156 RepID=UPI0026DB11A2|nr:uncharacterized protein ONS95_003418 [Cadophora gregata]KAK0108625.1 hypothetical protein ONS95_003418 [Cadophora gregata]
MHTIACMELMRRVSDATWLTVAQGSYLPAFTHLILIAPPPNFPNIHIYRMAASIKSSTRAPPVRKEMARLSGKMEWLDDRWWREFLTARRKFLSEKAIPAKPSVAQRIEVEANLKDWVNSSTAWWGGPDSCWAEDGSIIEWHLGQYIRARKDRDSGKYRFDSVSATEWNVK